uniref:Ubiquitin carboxyl-terminal hydrolase 14 n=1 Tax=Macrostomum lignano TaxID=282301 RepID=A0A1I8F709_9PLAT
PSVASWASAENGATRLSWQPKAADWKPRLNWAMDHSQDADFDLPPQQLQQQQQKQKTAGFEPNPEALATIVSMGFTQEQASRALSQTDNNPERAVDWIFSHMDELNAPADEAPPAAAAAADTGALTDGPPSYRLLGFISHMGASTHSGHYVCHLRRNNVWYIFNDDKRPEMYGRRVLEFETYQRAKDLPSHSIAPGDIVGIFHSQQEQQQMVLLVLLLRFWLELSALPWKRIRLLVLHHLAMVNLRGLLALLQKPPSLADLLLGERSLAPTRDLPPPSGESTAASGSSRGVSYFNPHLDESQRAAVELGLRRSDLVMIHGPPGTGKTTTVVELVRQLVDNLAERLIASGVRCVRLGHPARQLPQVVEHSLDALLARSEDRRIIADVRADIDKLLSGGRNRRIGAELRNLRSELRQREANCVKAILTRAQAVLCTLTVGGLNDDSTLKEIQFDATVIDDGLLAGVARAPKCILAGDPYQLPPTVRSERAVAAGFAVTLMERLLPRSAEATQLLTVQYRMHRDIMLWSSEAFYSNQLIAHQSVAGHRLGRSSRLRRRVGWRRKTTTSFPPLLLVDTAGCEIWLSWKHVSALVTSGLAPSDIAVISPYNLQVEHIRLAIQQQQQQQSTPSSNLQSVEVRSVDGFQGREKEAVIISLVRSNRKGIVGFLSEHRRLNVAVTRARRHLCVIGDCDTVGRGTASANASAGFSTEVSTMMLQILLGKAAGESWLVSKVSGATADKMATESDKTAAESDKTATESDKMATESDKTAAESDKTATESDKMATESDKMASGSDKMVSRV